MGVWIETLGIVVYHIHVPVTPFVGVWIETPWSLLFSRWEPVTPFVGVWIETKTRTSRRGNLGSHTLRGCVD